MKAMSNKGFGIGLATMDNGYGLFINMLAYKLDDRGKYLVKVDKWFPIKSDLSLLWQGSQGDEGSAYQNDEL